MDSIRTASILLSMNPPLELFAEELLDGSISIIGQWPESHVALSTLDKLHTV